MHLQQSQGSVVARMYLMPWNGCAFHASRSRSASKFHAKSFFNSTIHKSLTCFVVSAVFSAVVVAAAAWSMSEAAVKIRY